MFGTAAMALQLVRVAALSIIPVSADIPAPDPGCVTPDQVRQAIVMLFPGSASPMADADRSAVIIQKANSEMHTQIDADRVMISRIDDATTILTFFRSGCMVPDLRKTTATLNDR